MCTTHPNPTPNLTPNPNKPRSRKGGFSSSLESLSVPAGHCKRIMSMQHVKTHITPHPHPQPPILPQPLHPLGPTPSQPGNNLFHSCRPLQMYYVYGLGARPRGNALSTFCVSIPGRHCQSVGHQYKALRLHSVWPHPAGDLRQVGWGWMYTHQLPRWDHHGVGCQGNGDVQ